MASNLEKLKKVAKPQSKEDLAYAAYRRENGGWLKKSAMLSLAVEQLLRDKGMSKQVFAEKLGVTPPQVTKLLSGKENLGLKTIARIEEVLGEEIVSVPLVRRQCFVTLEISAGMGENIAALPYGQPSLAYENTNVHTSWAQLAPAI